jgi:hypothetical protein
MATAAQALVRVASSGGTRLKEVRMLASLPDNILVRLLGEIDEALSGDVDPIPAPIARATRLLQEYLLLRRA